MKVALLSKITTEEALIALEAEGKKYDGLYVDMDDKKQRKFVKDGAAAIAGLIKKIDRARIDLAKDYRNNIETEAKSITERLETANAPFSSLIDAHNEKRKSILAEEKRLADEAEEKRLAAIAQAERDEHHEMAFLMMAEDFRLRAEKAEQDRLDQIARDEAIALEATQKADREAAEAVRQAVADKQKAIDDAKYALERENQANIDAINARVAEADRVERERIAAEQKAEQDRLQAVEDEKQRVAVEQKAIAAQQKARDENKELRRSTNIKIKVALIGEAGLTEIQAELAIKAIILGLVPNTKISY